MVYPSTTSFPALFPEGFHNKSPAEGIEVSPNVGAPVTEGWKRTACTSQQSAGGCPVPHWAGEGPAAPSKDAGAGTAKSLTCLLLFSFPFQALKIAVWEGRWLKVTNGFAMFAKQMFSFDGHQNTWACPSWLEEWNSLKQLTNTG